MKNIIIIKTGDSIPELVAKRGDFEDWIVAGIGGPHPVINPIIPVHHGGELPASDSIGGVIITGSHAMVTDQTDWIVKTTEWLQHAVEQGKPILGICFGHQLLAHAMGGKVDWMPGGSEFGTVPLSLNSRAEDDPLFCKLPQPVEVQTSHHQSVTQLPPASTLLASTQKDPHSAFRYGQCAWGVQFHPEYDADIANSYIREFNRENRKTQKNTVDLPCDSRNTITGGILLSRFFDYVSENQ